MARRPRGYIACSFCGKGQDQARRLIAGPNRVYICDACVNLCNEIITDAEHNTPIQQTEGAPPTVDQRPQIRMAANRALVALQSG